MDNLLSYNAMMAWAAFGMQDYVRLAKHGNEIYNYFAQDPQALLNLDSPLLIGKIFQACLVFKEKDERTLQIRAENALLCFIQALKSDNLSVHDEACARLMILLICDDKYLKRKICQAFGDNYNSPWDFDNNQNYGLPDDMPKVTNIKLIYAAYFLYDSILDKENVEDEIISVIEKHTYEQVKDYIFRSFYMLDIDNPKRIVELGSIVFDKICQKILGDYESNAKNN